jgi:hypothetical protein
MKWVRKCAHKCFSRQWFAKKMCHITSYSVNVVFVGIVSKVFKMGAEIEQ